MSLQTHLKKFYSLEFEIKQSLPNSEGATEIEMSIINNLLRIHEANIALISDIKDEIFPQVVVVESKKKIYSSDSMTSSGSTSILSIWY